MHRTAAVTELEEQAKFGRAQILAHKNGRTAGTLMQALDSKSRIWETDKRRNTIDKHTTCPSGFAVFDGGGLEKGCTVASTGKGVQRLVDLKSLRTKKSSLQTSSDKFWRPRSKETGRYT